MRNLSSLIILLLTTSPVWSQNTTPTGLTYTIGNNVATITGYTGSGGSVVIPGTIDGVPVTAIASSAFYGKNTITNVVIPSGVTSMGLRAFQSCSSMVSISIPVGITTIPGSAFSGCTALSNLVLPIGVTTIEMSAFSACYSLENVSLPSSLQTIATNAFGFCIKLPSLAVPGSVKTIGDYAFHGCTILDTVVFQGAPPSVIGNWVFQDSKLDKIYYLASSAGWGASYAGISTQALQVSGKTTDGFSFELNNASYIITAYSGAEAVPALPSSVSGVRVTGIANAVFRYNLSVTTVNLPAGLSSLGEQLFENCTNLVSVSIPLGIKQIPRATFYNCPALTSITLPGSITEIGDSAFYGCRNLKNIGLPDGLTALGYSAFYGCSALSSLVIPSTVNTIKDQAFMNCTTLSSVSLPPTITKIESLTFSGCSGLTAINLPSTLKSIGDAAFRNCTSLQTVVIPTSVNAIGSGAFYGCKAFTAIEIPSGVVSIGGAAFQGCTGATSIRISASVSSMGLGTFNYTPAVREVFVDAGNAFFFTDGKILFDKDVKTLIYASPSGLSGSYVVPNTVINISGAGFNYCALLTAISLPASVANIEGTPFFGCSKLVSITISGSNHHFVSDGKAIYTKDGKTLLWAGALASLVGSYVIADGTVTLGGSSFVGCADLSQIIIPSSVTTIGAAAFDRCTALESLIIPSSVTSVGSYAFNVTSKLKRILFLGNKPIMGDSVFNYSALTEIYYASGNTGWSATLGGLPAIAIQPTSITRIPASISVVSSDRADLYVSAIGSAPLSYQWYRGPSGDTSGPIVGATSSHLLIPAVTSAGSYWVRIADAYGFLTDSPLAAITVSAVSPLTASHSAVGMGYQPDGGVIVTNTISYVGSAPTAINCAVLLPPGWRYLGSGGSEGSGPRPSYESGGLIEWTWSAVPASPIKFTYMVSVPAGTTGDQIIASIVTSQQNGTTFQAMAKPDPLIIRSASNHSADTNRDFKISLTELTRVIELYNYRSGTNRTGQFKIQNNTEDGFSPGP